MKVVAKRLAIFSLSNKEHVKVFNPFPLKKLNEYVSMEGNETYSQRHCLDVMDLRFSSVI